MELNLQVSIPKYTIFSINSFLIKESNGIKKTINIIILHIWLAFR